MKHSLARILATVLAGTLPGLAAASPLELFYDQPAGEWVEALPIGNGLQGAMVFGDPANERLQLNEGTIWAGGPYDPVHPEARNAIPQVRELVLQRKYPEAAALVDRSVIARPRGQAPYQTVGNLKLAFPHTEVGEYRRSLDLDRALTTVRYQCGGVTFTREAFASAPDQVIVLRLTASKPGQITFRASMDSPMNATSSTTDGHTLLLRGKGGDHAGIRGVIAYETRVRILTQGGEIQASDATLEVSAADEALLLITTATNFRRVDDTGADPAALTQSRITAAARKSAADLLSAHLRDYQALFRRVAIDLGTSESTRLPTRERIRRFAEGNDPALAALYYQFGRYLLISCSRPGGQPANLQGIWNDSLNPPWQSKYTININTEMNYWPAESGNLPECVEPLIRMVEDLAVTGAKTAREMYDARGWVVHHNTDLWRATAPIDGPNWGMWPCGGAWLCLHLWDRFEYSGDHAVLQRIYPILKGACEFFLDTLQPCPDGKWLVTNPSSSPENMHPHGSAICAGPAMDSQILRDLFAHTLQAAAILGKDEPFRKELAATRARLAPDQIGSSGHLQEWLEDWDLQAPERHHRHVSHLYGLYPGRDIHRRENPELAAAVAKSLDLRGDRATGWATAWRIVLWTHLADGDRAHRILSHLISPGLTYPNMFDAHPPFQIDGNFGGAAGIAEMLMQSRLIHTTREGKSTSLVEIELLPALPKAWPQGSVRGLRARGGFEVDLSWREGKLLEATVRSQLGGTARLIHGGTSRDVPIPRGKSHPWYGN